MKGGDIIIHPFRRANLGTSSYDLTLGEWFYREQPYAKYHHKIYNIYNQKDTEYVWGKKPFRAERAKIVFQRYKFNWVGIKPSDKVIVLEPGETILAHTNEFIGGRNHITTMMKARSSFGRVFISVCKCAGWGDVGYTNRWTMEISNNSSHYTIPLVVGRRIAQMIFFDTGEIAGADYTKTGKYNKTTDLKKLKRDWQPTMMLPRLWADRDIGQ